MGKSAIAETRSGPVFVPDPEQTALWPETSGNSINGLGERDKRRPSHVYWHDPGKIIHGPLQAWFYKKNADPRMEGPRKKRQIIMDRPLPPIAPEKIQNSPSNFANALKAVAREQSAEDVGIARMDQAWVYDDSEMTLPWIIIFAIAMDYDRVKTAPEIESGIEVVDQYARAQKVGKAVASWIREQGYETEVMAGPLAGPVTLIPPALAAGLGELGKHGSIIHPRLGAMFRLSAVATDMPLVADDPQEFGADGFCANCQACTNGCPQDAIFADKQRVRGTVKWYVDFDKCLPYFNETFGCGICLAACPWSRPGVADNLVIKLARRQRHQQMDRP